MKTAFLFNGQGAQYVGMGKDIYEQYPEAKEIYAKVSEITGVDAAEVSLRGTPELIKDSKRAQICLFALEMSIYAILSSRNLRPDIAAGFSFGEYPTLTAGGALSLEDGAKTILSRGSLMSESAAKRNGTMALVEGLSREAIEKRMAQLGPDLHIACFNTDSQFFIAGDRPKIEQLVDVVKGEGLTAVMLPVGGAFHSPFVEDASILFKDTLKKTKFKNLEFPVIGNVTASIMTTPEQILADTMEQMLSSVQWYKTILKMLECGVTTFVEIGPGHGLTGMVKKVDSSVELMLTKSSEDLNRTIERLSTIMRSTPGDVRGAGLNCARPDTGKGKGSSETKHS